MSFTRRIIVSENVVCGRFMIIDTKSEFRAYIRKGNEGRTKLLCFVEDSETTRSQLQKLYGYLEDIQLVYDNRDNLQQSTVD